MKMVDYLQSGVESSSCGPGEAEVWVTEPWTFGQHHHHNHHYHQHSAGEDSIGEGLQNRGCFSSTEDSNLPNLVFVVIIKFIFDIFYE